MRAILTGIVIMAIFSVAFAQVLPVFPADYYLMEPEKYLGKDITLSVAYVNPRNEQREDGLRQLDAETYNQHHIGGTLMILAKPAAAPALIRQCGTNHSIRVGSRTT